MNLDKALGWKSQLGPRDGKINVVANDTADLVYEEFMYNNYKDGRDTIHKSIKILSGGEEWTKFIRKQFDDFLILQEGPNRGILVNEASTCCIRYWEYNNSINVNIYSDQAAIDTISKIIENKFDIVTSYIKWVYSVEGHSVEIPLERDHLPVTEMYPFLNGESIEKYYDRYMNSSANVLLLLGPPGTGKTTFIRGLINYCNSSAILSYDEGVLQRDSFFAEFMENREKFMIIEDSDLLLKSRSDGNSLMHRFLNLSDGLVSTKTKKLIFSTNLPSVKNVDPALMRPGRCFDVLEFGKLNHDQAEILAHKFGRTLDQERDEWTIAEIFNNKIFTSDKIQSGNSKGFGFLS